MPGLFVCKEKIMHAEIIATGSELLLGEVVDTNSTYIARRLREIGLTLNQTRISKRALEYVVDGYRRLLARANANG